MNMWDSYELRITPRNYDPELHGYIQNLLKALQQAFDMRTDCDAQVEFSSREPVKDTRLVPLD